MGQVILRMIADIPGIGSVYKSGSLDLSVGTCAVADKAEADRIMVDFPGSFEIAPVGRQIGNKVSQSIAEHPKLSSRDKQVVIGEPGPQPSKPSRGRRKKKG